MERDIDGLKQDMDGLKQDVDGLKQDVDGLKQELSDTKAELKQDIRRVQNTVTVIEQEHGKKIQAALDGYTQLYEITKEIRSDVAELKSTQDTHNLRIHALRAAKG